MEQELTFQEKIEQIRQTIADGEAATNAAMAKHDAAMVKHDIAMAKHDAAMAALDAKLDKIAAQYGGFVNNAGEQLEDYFYNALERKKMFKGVHFDDVTPRVKPLTRKGIQDEYDIVMVNGTTVAIIEVKLHYHPNDIEKLLNKVKTFRVLFPEYKDYKVMLGLASKTFKRSDIAKANELGIGLIEENGDDIQDVNNVAKFF